MPLDRNPSGSSSGSGAESAPISAPGGGTETNGSIVGPASNCGVVGLKPTVGIDRTQRIIPISHQPGHRGHDPHRVRRCVLLNALSARPNDKATEAVTGIRPGLHPLISIRRALRSRKIGICPGGVQRQLSERTRYSNRR